MIILHFHLQLQYNMNFIYISEHLSSEIYPILHGAAADV